MCSEQKSKRFVVINERNKVAQNKLYFSRLIKFYYLSSKS